MFFDDRLATVLRQRATGEAGLRTQYRQLLDLLGRRVIELPLAGDGATIRGVMGLESVRPGLYMLVVRTADRVRTGKVIVTR